MSNTHFESLHDQRSFIAQTLPGLFGRVIAPLPLFPIQPVLLRIVREVTKNRPELFERLGPHVRSTFIIEVNELPFILRLCPDPERPELTAHRRSDSISHDAKISGPFAPLFDVMDGRADSDALFFSRDITISGNTEAAVCLRSALDDLDGSIVEDLMTMRGPLYAPLRFALSHLRRPHTGPII